MFNNKEFGKQVRKCRKALNLTISEFALALNITYQYLGNIEKGTQKPSISLTVDILNLLNMNFADCFNHNEIENAKKIKIDFVMSILKSFDKKDIEFLLEASDLLTDIG